MEYRKLLTFRPRVDYLESNVLYRPRLQRRV